MLRGLEAARGVPGLVIMTGRASESVRQAHSPLRVEHIQLVTLTNSGFFDTSFCFGAWVTRRRFSGLGSNPENAQVFQLSLRITTSDIRSPLSITMVAPVHAPRAARRMCRRSSSQSVLRASDNVLPIARLRAFCKRVLLPVLAKPNARRAAN